VVAVVVGHFLGGEVLDVRTALGTVLVLASVIVITMRRQTNATGGLAARQSVAGAAAQPDTQP
jgi:drug/metabolite transporter (DMT)-like permease